MAILSLLFLFCFSLKSWSQQQCIHLFKTAGVEKRIVLESAEMPLVTKDSEKALTFFRLTSGRFHGNVIAADLLPERDDYNRIIVGFKGAHTYLYFRGYRIDSTGIGGIRVTSLVKESPFIDGDLAFILHDIDSETLENLHHLIEDFKQKQKLTCVAISCAYLQDAKVEGFHKTHYRPSQFFNYLLARTSQGRGTDLVLLNPTYKTPLEFLKAQQKDEDLGEIVNTAVQLVWQKLKPKF